MTYCRPVALATPSASPIAGSAGSIVSMARALSAITIAIMNTISRSPGRRARGVASEEVGLCIAAILWTGSVGLTRAHPVHHAGIALPGRQRVLSGKSVAVRVDLGGRRLIKPHHERRPD